MEIQSVSLFVVASSALAAASAVPAVAEPSTSIDAAATADRPSGQPSSDRLPEAARDREGAGPRLALGLSSPLGWLRGPLRVGHSSFGASLSVGLDRHHAIRANVARYDSLEGMSILLAASGLRDSLSTGLVIDASLGWVYYPRRLWDGLMLEAGVLRRDRDVREIQRLFESSVTTTESVTYAGRAAIGWSWRVTQHMFISAAAGLSVGRERGDRATVEHDTYFPDEISMGRVDRVEIAPELQLRFGFTFGR